MRSRPKIKKRIKVRGGSNGKKEIIFLSFSLLLFIFFFLLVPYFCMPKIVLKLNNKEIGNSITLNYREKYRAPKYYAYYNGKEITKDIAVSGNVNPTKLGEYKIYYKSKSGIFGKVRVLTVYVRDTSSPSIKLIGSNITDVCPNQTYEEEGYKAYDNVDGDITNRVKVKKVRDKIIYSVKDKAGNTKEVVRRLVYQDKTSPVIELKGQIYENIYIGDEFKDSYVTVKDNCDNDLSKKVSVEGKVDTSTAGVYELIYKVEDTSHNASEIKRVVNVVEHGQNGTIYLTFDDGPKSGTTDVILDILKEENVKATFFITNNGPDELVIREEEEGHTVALHTATHNYAYLYSSVENYYNDLYSVRERVKRLTGKEASIIRFPGGSSNTISKKYTPGIMSILTKDVLEKGFHYYDWNLASGDAGEFHTADEIYDYVVAHLSKDRVNMVLMHDIKPYTRDALRRIITYGKENGYYFDKITEKTEMMTQRVNN